MYNEYELKSFQLAIACVLLSYNIQGDNLQVIFIM